MDILLPWAALLGPAALLTVFLASLRQPGSRPTVVVQAAGAAGGLGLVGAAASILSVALHGSWTSPVLGASGIGFALRLDALSVTMLALVAFMAWVLLRYSRNYLDGDDGHGRFLGLLALTAGCVMLLVLAGNLLHLAVFWAATSFALHRLLLFYPDRVGARVAGRKKFLVARAGDLALAGAAFLLYGIFETADLGLLLERAAALEAAPAGLLVATLLVALSAILKSAQFPTHGWLLEVMETPTPVSALLHAGIINGGTFLVVRLGDVVLLTPGAMHLLLVVGGFTAIFASVVMTTQNSVKVSLGYSSAAHMGFMLLLCGLGAFPVAILHLVAHSFYKAHAFLSSGSAVEAFEGGAAMPARTLPGVGLILTGMVAALGTVAGLALLLGMSPWEEPVTLGLAGVLAIALTQLWTRGIEHRGSAFVVGRTMMYAAGTTLAFFTLEAGAALLLGGAVPIPEERSGTTLLLMSGVVAAFATTVLLQLRLPALLRSPRWAVVWVHLRNGLYANVLFDRLVGALRIRTADALSQETL
jgi:NAD(P)H-quinone oxidoreductase subunit 5